MNESLFKSITRCRICDETKISPILDLGNQPPANSLRGSLTDSLPFVPLSIVHCENCGTVQLNETVKPDFLFRNYVWVTGTSSTAKTYSSLFCEETLKRLPKGPLFVVEVASNDGTFLKQFKDRGHKVLGVDPAKNIAQIANDNGISTLTEFFGSKVAEGIVNDHGEADCVFARNVIPHVENVHDVISGMARSIKDNGIAIIEFHYAKHILNGLQYDSIYHEHLFYFSIQSLCFLLNLHGLWAYDFIESPINGGSLVLYCTKTKRTNSAKFQEKIQDEKSDELGLQARWLEFASACLDHKQKLNKIIDEEINKGTKIIGYGASARSSTLLNFCGINHNHLICIADGNPLKEGKYTAGTDIPIVKPDNAFKKNPDAVFLLGWNFKEELLSIIKGKYGFHGKVILPLPNDPQVMEI